MRIGARVFGIASFRDTFYRPDLVTKGLAGQSLASFGSIDSVKLSPVVELVDLPASINTSTAKITVRLSDGGGGFGPIRLFHNGASIKQDSEGPSDGSTFTHSFTAPLFNGPNQLRITASNADGSMWSEVSDQITAHFPVSQAAHGTLHALVVGIQEFPRAPANNLTYARADAALVADTLRKSSAALFERLDIKLLTTPAETDRDHVLQALKAMQASVGPDDDFLFYVASHGMVAQGDYYLITSNVGPNDPASLQADAISNKELSALLANIPAVKKLVIVDTCDAGAVNDALKAALESGGLNTRSAMTILSRDYGMTVLAAAASNQEALEAGDTGHGLFTSVVADGLAGKAADPQSGVISSFSLADFVQDEVGVMAQTLYRRNQQPTTSKDGQSFPVATVR